MKRWLPALAVAALAACGGGETNVKHQVLTPPPSAPHTQFFVEKAQMQSRETGDEAWQRNEDYGRALTEALRNALQSRGKSLVQPPADSVRSKVYLAFGATPGKGKGGKAAEPRIEIQLQLIDGTSQAVLYSTHTVAPLESSLLTKVGLAPEGDQLIREVLQKAADDFASRL